MAEGRNELYNLTKLNKDDHTFYKEKIVCTECGKTKETGEEFTKENIIKDICSECKIKIKNKTSDDYFFNKVPPIYKNVNIENCPDINKGIFYGSYGTGKTWSIWAMAKKSKVPFIIMTEFDILTDIKSGFKDGSFEDKLKKYKDIDFLGIDEFGKVPDSDYNKGLMFSVLNYRHEWDKKTIISCNCINKEALKQIIPLDVLDRFKHGLRSFDGNSKR